MARWLIVVVWTAMFEALSRMEREHFKFGQLIHSQRFKAEDTQRSVTFQLKYKTSKCIQQTHLALISHDQFISTSKTLGSTSLLGIETSNIPFFSSAFILSTGPANPTRPFQWYVLKFCFNKGGLTVKLSTWGIMWLMNYFNHIKDCSNQPCHR